MNLFVLFSLLAYDGIKVMHNSLTTLEVSEQVLVVFWFKFYNIGWRTKGIMQAIAFLSGCLFSNIRSVDAISGFLYLDFLKARWITLIRMSITCVQE